MLNSHNEGCVVVAKLDECSSFDVKIVRNMMVFCNRTRAVYEQENLNEINGYTDI
jgi:hypothetical protein